MGVTGEDFGGLVCVSLAVVVLLPVRFPDTVRGDS